ncbi:FecCD family ABC transporter permease [Tianweitania populi]|uniref:Enterobactin ABC transporter permease n=1 Tax=Tianweitania populi TaxID=1607949 RepID=A0A8J3GJ76_9HYPH|nr:iron ABC transporter permease [Tianweitania populi]GHD05506.1 enterobactin ABC transporter permease [Tianweitania populi]
MKSGLLLVILLLAAILLSLMIGEVAIGPAALWHGLVSGEGPGALTIRVLRGPRIATALGAGTLLGLSGALLQTLLRNPLAAPDVLGFNSGAGLAVIFAVSVGLTLPMPLLAAGGGLIAALVMAALAYRPGHPTSTLTLILVGLGVGFTAAAIGSFLLLTLPNSEATEAQRWLSGSLAARDWGHAAQVWIIGAVLAVAVAAQIPALKLLELGHDLSAGLGLHVERARWSLVGTAVLLAAAAVAVAGPIPFVALMAPPLGAALTGARLPAARLFAAAGAGALICVASDLVARAAIPGLQLPIAVMTGLLGAPYLLWRLSREMEKGEL